MKRPDAETATRSASVFVPRVTSHHPSPENALTTPDDEVASQAPLPHAIEEIPPAWNVKTVPVPEATWIAPDELVGALRSLYASYDRTFRHWQEHLETAGHTPPVFIVVCSNTAVS